MFGKVSGIDYLRLQNVDLESYQDVPIAIAPQD